MIADSKGGTGFGLSVDADVPCRIEALRLLSKPAGGGHPQAKRVSADTLLRVDRNKPFEDYPRAVYGWKRVFEGEDREEVSESYWQAVENFLRRTFHSLMFIPEISFDVRKSSEKTERKAFNAAIARYRAAKMAGHAALLKELYDGLCALRIVLRDVNQSGLLETVIPVRFLPELSVGLFDYLVIATPYHDIASMEWGQIRWVRNVDPFLLGFVRQVPELKLARSGFAWPRYLTTAVIGLASNPQRGFS